MYGNKFDRRVCFGCMQDRERQSSMYGIKFDVCVLVACRTERQSSMYGNKFD